MFITCKTIFSHQLKEHLTKYTSLINKKDLEQATAVRELGIKYLVSYDKHFKNLEEHRTPKQFAQLLGLRTTPSNYENSHFLHCHIWLLIEPYTKPRLNTLRV